MNQEYVSCTFVTVIGFWFSQQPRRPFVLLLRDKEAQTVVITHTTIVPPSQIYSTRVFDRMHFFDSFKQDRFCGAVSDASPLHNSSNEERKGPMVQRQTILLI